MESTFQNEDTIKLDSNLVKALAKESGFDACGLAQAEPLIKDREFMTDWLKKGYQGNMSYLERNLDKRTDPQKLVPGCKTVVALLVNYYTDKQQPENSPRIARYAFPEVDYHTVIKQKLKQLESKLIDHYGREVVNNSNQHSFVDSAPVLERKWAQKAGLGWIGKHSLLINPQMGSFVFIAILLLQNTVDKYDKEFSDRCGTCTRCLNACPTSALTPRIVEARKCISYLTIENKENIPAEFKGILGNQLIGCDICQEVCPWNKKLAIPHSNTELRENPYILSNKKEDWEQMDKNSFNLQFKSSAIKRAGYEKIKSNLEFIHSTSKANNPDAQI